MKAKPITVTPTLPIIRAALDLAGIPYESSKHGVEALIGSPLTGSEIEFSLGHRDSTVDVSIDRADGETETLRGLTIREALMAAGQLG